MRRLSLLLGLVTASALLAAPAFAQQRAPAPPSSAPAPPPVIGQGYPRIADPSAPNDVYRADALQRQLFAQVQTRLAQGQIPSARVRRASRVSALIDQNLCGPAAQLARAEHDDEMADRVPEVCSAHRAHPNG